MKIAIISDTHDNLPNFEKAIGWIKKQEVETVIHCGDVCSPQVLKQALKNFSGKVFLVLGNADIGYGWETYSPSGFLNLKIFKNFGEIKAGDRNIAFCHFSKIAKKLCQSNEYDLVFYGHTHKPWLEEIGQCKLVNPGNLAGTFCKPTFAIYNTKTNVLELKILEKL